jgi:replicative DNA helicase
MMTSDPKKPQSEALKKFQEQLEADKSFDKRKKEVQEKRLLVDEHKLTNELNRIAKNEEDAGNIANIKVDCLSNEEINDIVLKNRLYLEGAKNSLSFLTPELGKIIPMWPGNLILIGSVSGAGKSSTATNLALNTMKQRNPITGNVRRVLYISNEETKITFMNKMTCLALGYNYDNQDDFTEEQKQQLLDFIPKWANAGLNIIGDDSFGTTTCLEGIRGIFEQLVKTNTLYDLVILDYIQKVSTSKKDEKMVQWQVMKETMYVLDFYKDRYPAPIVVMSQLKDASEENPLNFQNRLEGFKGILQPATVALELVPNRELLQSKWLIWKNRYKGGTVGGWKDVAYDKGMFKPLTDEWKAWALSRKERRDYQETVGKHVQEEKKEEIKE